MTATAAIRGAVAGDDADVIVVGGGHNGLVCAAYLARAGANTMLVEARSAVGGCASTVSDLGARFNICNCDHSMVRAMPFIDELGLGEHGLRYLEADPAYVHMGLRGEAPWLFFADAERTAESIARHRPDAARAYRRYLADARPVAELALELSTGAVTTPRMLAALFRRRARGSARLLRWSRASAVDVLGSYFDDEALIMPAVSTGPTVWGASPEAPGTGMTAAIYALRHLVKAGRPVGGSGALTDALAAAFASFGGRVLCDAFVTGLLTDRGAGGRRAAGPVRGVRLADGAEITAGVVVAACDPAVVASQWLPAPGGRAARRFASRGGSGLLGEGYESKIDAVIADAPRYAALDDSRLLDLFEGRDPNESSYIISPSLEDLAEAHRLRAQGRVAPNPTLLSNVPSVLDEAMRSEDGLHVLSLEVLLTPYSLPGGWPGSTEPRRWLELWSGLIQPGFLDSVDRWRVMTPDRYERELFLHRGHAPSYAGTPVSSMLGRRRELSRYRTPVPGLFLSGAGTYPGAGVWGAAGRNAADAVLRAVK